MDSKLQLYQSIDYIGTTPFEQLELNWPLGELSSPSPEVDCFEELLCHITLGSFEGERKRELDSEDDSEDKEEEPEKKKTKFK